MNSLASITTEDPTQPDIIEEAITLFRPNSLFRNFEIKGAADRTLIYLILFISDCLNRIGSPSAKGWSTTEAVKQLTTLALENFALPGDAGFPLNSMFQAPKTRADADLLRQYLGQCRQEMAGRIVDTVYGPDGKPSKWWMAFQVHILFKPAPLKLRADTALLRNDDSWASPCPAISDPTRQYRRYLRSN